MKTNFVALALLALVVVGYANAYGSDPSERDNLAAKYPEVVTRLKDKLATYHPPFTPAETRMAATRAAT